MWGNVHSLLCLTIKLRCRFIVATAPSVRISASLTAQNALDRMEGRYAGSNKSRIKLNFPSRKRVLVYSRCHVRDRACPCCCRVDQTSPLKDPGKPVG
jgi:hypothetical protein